LERKNNGRKQGRFRLAGNSEPDMEGHFGKRLTGLTHVAGAGEQQGTVSVFAAVPLDSYISNDNVAGKRVAFIKCDVEATSAGDRWSKAPHRPMAPPDFAEAKEGWFRRYGKTSTNLFEILNSYGYSGSIFSSDGTLQKSRQQAIQDPAISCFVPMS